MNNLRRELDPAVGSSISSKILPLLTSALPFMWSAHICSILESGGNGVPFHPSLTDPTNDGHQPGKGRDRRKEIHRHLKELVASDVLCNVAVHSLTHPLISDRPVLRYRRGEKKRETNWRGVAGQLQRRLKTIVDYSQSQKKPISHVASLYFAANSAQKSDSQSTGENARARLNFGAANRFCSKSINELIDGEPESDRPLDWSFNQLVRVANRWETAFINLSHLYCREFRSPDRCVDNDWIPCVPRRPRIPLGWIRSDELQVDRREPHVAPPAYIKPPRPARKSLHEVHEIPRRRQIPRRLKRICQSPVTAYLYHESPVPWITDFYPHAQSHYRTESGVPVRTAIVFGGALNEQELRFLHWHLSEFLAFDRYELW